MTLQRKKMLMRMAMRAGMARKKMLGPISIQQNSASSYCLWSVEFGVCSIQCEVWSVECGVWSVQYTV